MRLILERRAETPAALRLLSPVVAVGLTLVTAALLFAMLGLDPWNALNYLAIGKIYKEQGNLVESEAMLNKILSFASSDPIAAQAKAELAP
jgi:ABC-type uncharacterized transport system permease subunit